MWHCPVPTVTCFVALTCSMAGLAYAMRSLPTGTSYAVWVGICAAPTVAYTMVAGDEMFSRLKVVLLVGIIGCVVGLRLLP